MRWMACGYTAAEKPISRMVLNQLRVTLQGGTATFSGASAAMAAVTTARSVGVGTTASSRPVNPASSMIPCTQSVQATARMPPIVS